MPALSCRSGAIHYSLNQQRTEAGNQVIDQIGKTVERSNQRFAVDNPWFAEGYLKSELHILCRFRAGGIDEEYVALFQREHSIGVLEEDVLLDSDYSGIQLGVFTRNWSAPIETAQMAADEGHKSALVNVAKLVESP